MVEFSLYLIVMVETVFETENKVRDMIGKRLR